MGEDVAAVCPPVLNDVDLLGVVAEAFPVSDAAALFFSSDQVRNSFCKMYFAFASDRFMMINSQWLTLRRSSKYSTDQWYLLRC